MTLSVDLFATSLHRASPVRSRGPRPAVEERRLVRHVAAAFALAAGVAAQEIPFAPSRESIAPEAPFGIAADVDGDGRPDLVATLPSGGYAVHRNDGDGRFSPASLFAPSGLATLDGAAADFNGDGFVDLLGAQQGFAFLRFGAAGGALGAVQPTPSLTGTTFHVAAGDVDADGDLDVLISCSAVLFGVPQAKLWKNNGAGVFSDATASSGLASGAAVGALRDLDGDGVLDVLAQTTPQNFPGSVVAQRGLGGGVFAPLVSVASFASAASMARRVVFDVDRDGMLDVVVEGPAAGALQWSRQTAPFVFTPQGSSSVGFDVTALAAVDLDGDGFEEAVALGPTGVVAFPGGASFGSASWPLLAEGGTALLAADFDDDGDQDLVASDARGHRRAWFNDGAGGLVAPFGAAPSGASLLESPAQVPLSLAVADHDSDGHADIVAYGMNQGLVRFAVAYGDGDGRFSAAGEATLNFAPTPGNTEQILEALDYDADGDVDYVIYTLNGSATFAFLRNDGAAGLTRVLWPSLTGPAANYARADLDSDGDLDFVVGTYAALTPPYSFDYRVLVNDGSGGFVVGPQLPVTDATAIAFGDFDDDGALDFVTSGGTGAARIFVQSAPLVFTLAAILANDVTATVAVGDLDGDGRDDVVSRLRIFRRNGPLSFDPEVVVPDVPFGNVYAFGTRLVDLDGDGDLDLLDVAQRAYWRNGGGLAFTPYLVPVGAGEQVRFGDFDRDGDADYVTGKNRLYENRTVHLRIDSPLRAGAVGGFRIHGAPGAAWWIAVDLAAAPFSVATPFGRLALDPATAIVLGGGTFDSAGAGAFEAYVDPATATAVGGLEFVFQALTDGPQGVRLTGARTLKIGSY